MAKPDKNKGLSLAREYWERGGMPDTHKVAAVFAAGQVMRILGENLIPGLNRITKRGQLQYFVVVDTPQTDLRASSEDRIQYLNNLLLLKESIIART